MYVYIVERSVEADYYSRELQGVWSTLESAKASVESDADISEFGPWYEFAGLWQRMAPGDRFIDMTSHFVFGPGREESLDDPDTEGEVGPAEEYVATIRALLEKYDADVGGAAPTPPS